MNLDEISGHGKEIVTDRLLLSNIIYLIIYQNLHNVFLTWSNKKILEMCLQS